MQKVANIKYTTTEAIKPYQNIAIVKEKFKIKKKNILSMTELSSTNKRIKMRLFVVLHLNKKAGGASLVNLPISGLDSNCDLD